LEDIKFSSSQLQKNPRDLIDFGRFQTTSEKIPEAGLFHIAMLRGGTGIGDQGSDALTL
jgi:hypothetical protein